MFILTFDYSADSDYVSCTAQLFSEYLRDTRVSDTNTGNSGYRTETELKPQSPVFINNT